MAKPLIETLEDRLLMSHATHLRHLAHLAELHKHHVAHVAHLAHVKHAAHVEHEAHILRTTHLEPIVLTQFQKNDWPTIRESVLNNRRRI